MTNWHLISVPYGYTECERYGNCIIAVKDGAYKGFGRRYETRAKYSRAECRAQIDACMAEKL